MNKIYTRTGDGGDTRLATGASVSKTDARVEAYGAVDEANASIGLARAALADPVLDAILARVQNDLFDVGADLATPGPDEELAFEPLRIQAGQAARLEADIDAVNADLSPLSSFVLPAGSEAAARLHVARTVTRRAERRAIALALNDPGGINPAAIVYLNRLSDLLFVAARRANANGENDVLWVPGASRDG
ncbi:MAG: cob(I)yrinic acid a,c-diamide adenosyltransferase [Caulobacterales bacterium]|nr:cob(I)yrinic acid a,c-diamide adenosyltransferase [Caulobacterales bacterium]